jgi:D-arginine dehydrogenase
MDQEAAMQKAAATYASLVPSVRWLEPAEALKLQPLLKPETAGGGAIFEPEADDMDVAAIHAGFLRGARAAGGVLRLNAEVTALERKDGVWAIRLRDGETIRAVNIVNAAGAWADVLGGLAGTRPVGLVPKRRPAFTIDAPAPSSRRCPWSSTSTRAGTSSPRSASSSPRPPTRRRRSRATRNRTRWTSPSPSTA